MWLFWKVDKRPFFLKHCRHFFSGEREIVRSKSLHLSLLRNFCCIHRTSRIFFIAARSFKVFDIFRQKWQNILPGSEYHFTKIQQNWLSGPPKCIQRCRRACRKFPRATWRKSCSSKHEILSAYSTWLWGFIFQNLNSVHFS